MIPRNGRIDGQLDRECDFGFEFLVLEWWMGSVTDADFDVKPDGPTRLTLSSLSLSRGFSKVVRPGVLDTDTPTSPVVPSRYESICVLSSSSLTIRNRSLSLFEFIN